LPPTPPRPSSPIIPPAAIRVPAPARPEERTSGLATEPVHPKTLIDPQPSGLAVGPVQNTLLGTPAETRRRAPTVPSDPPITRLAERAATDPSAWSATPAEPIRRSNEAPVLRDAPRRPSDPTTLRPDEPPYPQRPTPKPMIEPAAREPQRTLPGELPLRAPAKASDPINSTMRGPSAPVRLPASPEAPPRYPAEPSVHSDASAPTLRPSSPTATPTRTAGPPEPVELDSAITNPPPMRRGGSAPPPQRDVSPATRLPGILLHQEALDHDARLARSDLDHDDLGVTAPRMPVHPPIGRTSPFDAEDAGRTEPSLPRVDLPLRAPPTHPPPNSGAQDGSWAGGLAARIDSAVDEWGTETPVMAPSKAELRALLGAPDPTRQQSIEELERLHEAARELHSDPEILPPRPTSNTHEIHPDDIEASIEIAPRARTRSPSAIGVAKPKKPT
jgi:hypothetical protein